MSLNLKKNMKPREPEERLQGKCNADPSVSSKRRSTSFGRRGKGEGLGAVATFPSLSKNC